MFIIIITAELILEANVSYLWLVQVTFAIVWKTRTSFASSPTSLTRRGEEEAFEDMLDLEGHLSLQRADEDLAEGEMGKMGHGTLPNMVTLKHLRCHCVCVCTCHKLLCIHNV